MRVSLRPRRRGVAPVQAYVPTRAEGAFYEVLMRVSFEHAYYNLEDGACPDFSVQPTGITAALMKSLSLVFRDEGTGFSVLYDRGRKGALCNFLQRQGQTVDELLPEFWTRLSFLLVPRNPYFLNITNLPIDASLTDWRYYLTNMEAHGAVLILLNTGDVVTKDEILPVTEQETVVPVDMRFEYVEARAISGVTVLREPCSPTRDYGNGRIVTQNLNAVHMDFSTVPQGKYTIGRVTHFGAFEPWQVGVYADDSLSPFAFVDLLFSQPKDSAGGIYPVVLNPSGVGGAVEPVSYTLAFEARSTQWLYYVVQQAASDPFERLRIESESGDISFNGPFFPIELPNGDEAAFFASEQALLLRQQSPYNFRLLGRHAKGSRREEEILKRMPVSSAAQVTPKSDMLTAIRARAAPKADGNSTMYVYV